MKKSRSDKGRTMVSPRDMKAMRWVAEQYAATLDQVQQLLGRDPGKETRAVDRLSESAARQVVARWRKLGYAEQQKILSSSSTWIWLTREGLLQFGGAYQFYAPRLGALAHLHAVNAVRLYLEFQRPGDIWTSERALRARQPQYTQGATAPHLPDGELANEQGVFAIEVELSAKEHTRLLTIVRELVTDYYTVLYFASAGACAAVEAAKNQLPSELQARVKVYQLEKINGYHQIAG